MLSGFTNLFKIPEFDDPEQAAHARSIYTILLSTLILTCLFLLYAIFFPPPGQIIIAGIAICVELALMVLVQTKRVTLASGIFTSLLWAAIVIEVALYGGIRDTGFGAFAAIILIAGLTMGTRGIISFTALSLAAAGGLAFAESQSLLPAYVKVPITSVLVSHGITLIAVALILNLAIRSISMVARKAIEKEKEEEGINTLLETSQATLEQRSLALEQRNTTLEIVATISRIGNRVKSEAELLEQSANLLIEKNNLEYVSIFVLDQTGEYALLQIGRGRAGDPLPTAGYKLNVIRTESSTLLIGANTLNLKVGESNYYIDSPTQLPSMETSVVFPMISGDHLLGLLNIQTSASDPQAIDKQTLQMLADQIALSMENSRLVTQLQSRIQEIGVLAGGAVRGAWEQLESGGLIGYAYDRLQVMPTDETFPAEVTEQILAKKSVSFVSKEPLPRARLVAPIILRESVIGVVGYDSNHVDHEWQDDEKVLLETVAARVSLALENTRLVAEAQQRAERERVISQVTTRMRETLDIDTILKTAVKEMRQSLELSEAEVRLQFAEEVTSTEVNLE